jgi:hypothetical protein
MVEVMELQCPACRQVLRVPSDWAEQVMRCKHCKNVFQAHRKSATPAAISTAQPTPESPALGKTISSPAKTPGPPHPTLSPPGGRGPGEGVAAQVANPAPASGSPFDFDGPGTAVTVTPRLARRGSRAFGVVKAVLLGAVVLAGVGTAAVVILVVLGNEINKLFNAEPANQRALFHTKKDSPPGPGTPQDTAKQPGGDPDAVSGNPNRRKPKVEPKKEVDPPDSPIGASYPRRALLISICDYVIAPPLPYGRPAAGGFLGSNPRALAARLEESLDFSREQIGELSDKAVKPVPPKKAAIEDTIVEFLTTSRGQDCILLVFSGHVVEVGQEAYFVPADGKAGDPKSLISFDWLYQRLGKCRAHQKVLVLDIGHGATIGDVLAGKIKQPPANVRVWTACLRGERALETTDGSLFLEALCHSCKNVLTRQNELIPVDTLARKVDQYIQEKTKGRNHQQTAALCGTDKAGPVPLDAKESPAPAVAIKAAPVVFDPQPHVAELKAILDELALIPQATDAKLPPLKPVGLEFPAKMFADYKADYKNLMEFKSQKEKFPVRAAIAEALLALRNAATITMRPKLDNKQGNELAALKNAIRDEQVRLSDQQRELKDALGDLVAVEDHRLAETKRWQVLYDFVLLRLKARLVHVADYNFILGNFRGDTREELGQGDRLWQLARVAELSTNEKFYKGLAKEITKGWEKLQKNFPETPWAIQAQRESALVLGLTWRPSKN